MNTETRIRVSNVIMLSLSMLAFIAGHLFGFGPALGIGCVAGLLLYDAGKLLWGASTNRVR